MAKIIELKADVKIHTEGWMGDKPTNQTAEADQPEDAYNEN